MKFVFVTGGVISGLGKGVTTSSLGCLFGRAGYNVGMVKMDPYLQVDAGTMSPYEHGEVYVCADGSEADLDLGNYERFVGFQASGASNITSGKVYLSVIQKERRGEYLGKTVQAIPHVTNEIVDQIAAAGEGKDITFIEVGGMVGDLESPLFIEAVRQFRKRFGQDNVAYVHVVPLLYLPYSGELKTKALQNSVRDLRSAGIQPDILICRTPVEIPQDIRQKISLFSDVDDKNIIENRDLQVTYELPLLLKEQGMMDSLSEILNLPSKNPDLSDW